MSTRWHHSRVFWLGLVGLIMLLIMWGTPPRTQLDLSISTASAMYSIGKDPSSIVVRYLNYKSLGISGYVRPKTWEATRTKLGKEWVPREIFAPPFRKATHLAPVYAIGIWFIVAVYVVLWYGIMVWWLRRKHRLMNSPPGPV